MRSSIVISECRFDGDDAGGATWFDFLDLDVAAEEIGVTIGGIVVVYGWIGDSYTFEEINHGGDALRRYVFGDGDRF